MVYINTHTYLLCDLVIHPCPYCNEVRALMSNSTPLSNVDVITHSCPNYDTGFDNLFVKSVPDLCWTPLRMGTVSQRRQVYPSLKYYIIIVHAPRSHNGVDKRNIPGTHLLYKRGLRCHEQRRLRTTVTHAEVTWCCWKHPIVAKKVISNLRSRSQILCGYGEMVWGWTIVTRRQEEEAVHLSTYALCHVCRVPKFPS